MTIEEKVKAYDRALKVLHKYDGANIMFSQSLKEEMFPALKESDSEDEKIKKAIIEFVRQNNSFTYSLGISKEQVIAWLEKQGEKKSADKIEPKFKIGDWVVNKGHSYLIAYIDYEQRRYLFEIGGYTHEQLNWEYIENADNKYHLWTIQDAKDGDVLTTDTWTFIFKKYQDKSAYYHCASFTFNDFSISDTGEFDSNCVHPATKEQSDLLFQKMKEAGYEWDAEKKELKKIEQKPVNIDYISGIRQELLNIENNAENIVGLTESQWVAIRAAHRLLGEYIAKEQKPSWSEEDRDYYDAIIAKLELTRYDALLTDNQMVFLKSLKERYT